LNTYGYVGGNPVNLIDIFGLCGCENEASYIDRVIANFSDTNSAGANEIRTLITLGSAGKVAQSTQGITFLQFAFGGFKGAQMGAAKFTALETALTAGATGLQTGAYVGLSLESGILAGSFVNGISLSCDSVFRSTGATTVRDVVSGTIEQIFINFEDFFNN